MMQIERKIKKCKEGCANKNKRRQCVRVMLCTGTTVLYSGGGKIVTADGRDFLFFDFCGRHCVENLIGHCTTHHVEYV